MCEENKRKKESKKLQPHKSFFNDRKDFVWLLQTLDVTNVDELQVNNSSHTKGTYYLSSKWMNGHRKDGCRVTDSIWLERTESLLTK